MLPTFQSQNIILEGLCEFSDRCLTQSIDLLGGIFKNHALWKWVTILLLSSAFGLFEGFILLQGQLGHKIRAIWDGVSVGERSRRAIYGDNILLGGRAWK